jgi:putative intracellular protease/amidase
MADKHQIAIVLYPGMTALDALGPYEILKLLPDFELRLVTHKPGPVVTDRHTLSSALRTLSKKRRIHFLSSRQARRPTQRRRWPTDDCSHG